MDFESGTSDFSCLNRVLSRMYASIYLFTRGEL